MKHISILLLTLTILVILSGCQLDRNQNKNQPGIMSEEQLQSSNNDIIGNTNENNNEEQFQNETDTRTKPILGYVHNFDKDTKHFDFELVEWITNDDSERIEELNLNPDNDMPGGFYIYIPDVDKQSYDVSDSAEYQIIDWEQNGELTVVNADRFANNISGFYENKILCFITIDNGSVISLIERYIP